MCGGPAWKREVVQDHKFDFVDVRDFTDNGFTMRMKYLWLYLIVLKDFLVYVSDIFTAITMISTTSWVDNIKAQCPEGEQCLPLSPSVTQWLFFGCIIFSFLLLAYESRKTRKIIASRDISYAFTNVMANNYYSLRSYDHFCFFDHISNSTKKKDDLVLFVFFTFKSWKRVLLADGPRQTINALVLYYIIKSKSKVEGQWWNIMRYFPDGQKLSVSALTVTMLFTVLVFLGSLLLLIAAACIYIPLLCYIQGNLKEYVCHKVDKRISTIIKRRNKERLAKAAELAKKEAMGDFSHLKNKRGELIAKPLPQPTLPNLSVDDDIDDNSLKRARATPAPSYATAPPSMPPSQDSYYYSSDPNQPLDFHQMGYQQGYGHYPNPSQGTVYDDNESTMHLTEKQQYQQRPVSTQPSPGLPLPNPHQYYTSDAYSGFEEVTPQQSQQTQQTQQWYQGGGGRTGYAQ